MKQLRLPILALIIANIIWGAAAPIYKWSMANGNIEPATLGFLRFFIAAIILFPFVYKHLKIEKSDYKMLLGLGIALFFHILLLNVALVSTDSINAPIIGTAAPLFLIPASFFILKEKVKIRKIIGGIIGFLGVLIILLLPIIEKGLDGSVFGNVLLVLSTIGAVTHTILTKEIIKKYQPLVLVFWTFVVCSILFFPVSFLSSGNQHLLINFSWYDFVGIFYAGIFASVFAYFLFYYAIKGLEVSDVGVFTYLDPVLTVLVAAPLLGEIPSVEYVIGSFLVFAGIYVAEQRLHYHPIQMLFNRK